MNYDLALLKLRNGFDIPNIPNVSPACLPSMDKAPANVDVSLVLSRLGEALKF